ncbi:hypothetical protein O181_015793 [Austropuccinia psidii MF-1]|uniref:Sld7 C-terminal domain-containing protein n=1 Tax=Austropuccinia psidii MF-1 TaxID=1389203 RepID=A0A9Q3GQA3_9BASI|nr:hypothetical protein [Austropuccinia psidii MF-1]
MESKDLLQNSNGLSGHHTNHRLLWRGAIVTSAGLKLHGLAIVAHAMDLVKASRSKEDPFGPDSYSTTLSETCLEIEMLRGSDLYANRQLKFSEDKSDPLEPFQGSRAQDGRRDNRRSRVASLLKGKGLDSGAQLREFPFSEVDCSSEVRLYIDPRCGQTHNWFMSQLCKRNLAPGGYTRDALVLALDQGLEDQLPRELIIFGRRVADDVLQPSTSTATVPLQLVIGQRKVRASPQSIPRPDDPMPRASTLLFPQSPKRIVSRKLTNPFSTKKKALTNPTAEELVPVASESMSIKCISRSVSKPASVNSAKRPPKLARKPANTPGRRMLESTPAYNQSFNSQGQPLQLIPQTRGEKRELEHTTSISTKKIRTIGKVRKEGYQLPDVFDSIVEAEEDGKIDIIDENCFTTERSPSPSPATFKSRQAAYLPTPDTLGSPSRLKKPLGKAPLVLGDPDANHKPSKTSSDPDQSKDVKTSIHINSKSGQRRSPKPLSHLEQNKLTIRKLALESLTIRGIEKGHPKFKDLFAAVCRGVQFGMREVLDKQPIDKMLTKSFVEGHLGMYMVLSSASQS